MDKIKIKNLVLEFEELFENCIRLPLKLQGKEEPYFNVIDSDDGYELVYHNIDIYFHKYDFNVYIDNLSEEKFKNLAPKFKNIKSLKEENINIDIIEGGKSLNLKEGENFNYSAEALPDNFTAFSATGKRYDPPNELAYKYGRSQQNHFTANKKMIKFILIFLIGFYGYFLLASREKSFYLCS
jgi:hypothetical protein